MSRITQGSIALRQWVDRRAISQLEAAALIGIEYSLFNKYVLGYRRAPLEAAIKIHRATGISVEAWVSPVVDETAEPVAVQSGKRR